MTTLVQSTFASGYGGTGAGLSLALPGTATAGNSICVTIVVTTTASIVSVKTSTGQDLTLDKTAETSQTGAQNILFYSVPVVTGAPTGVVLKMTTDEAAYSWIEEVSGMATASVVDVDPTKATGSSTTPTISVTTTTANAYIRYLSSYASGQTFTAGAGYTAAYTASLGRHGQFNVDVGSAGAKSVSATIGGSDSWAVSAIAYKSAGGGGATVSTITGTTATEGSSIVFTATMSGTGGGTFAYSWSGTATSADYTQTLTTGMCAVTGGSGNVTVSGSNITVDSTVTAFTVTVPTTDDSLNEAAETIRLVIGGVTASSGTINDNDAQPSISVNDVTQSGGFCTFTVSLSAASGQTVTVDYATANGTKTAGVDYTAKTGTLTFAAGETTKTVAVSVP